MTSSPLHEIPDPREELQRKTLETLSAVEHRFETGQITEKGRLIALQTITEITQGLVDSDINHAISEILVTLRERSLTDQAKTVLSMPNGTVCVIVLDYGNSEILMTSITDAKSKTRTKELDPFDAISPLTYYQTAIETLEGKGAVVIA